ncbi:MAG: hypothetical protein ACLFV7_01385 [Phycisphaerae bacterium]
MILRTLSIEKDGHLFMFRYTPGCEDYVVEELVRLAEDPDHRVDWLDAATLSFQVTHHAAQDCSKALSPYDVK